MFVIPGSEDVQKDEHYVEGRASKDKKFKRINGDQYNGVDDGDDIKKRRVKSAADARAAQRDLSVRDAIKEYRWAIFWCFVVSMCVVMEGYDAILLESLYPFPAFAKKYGQPAPNGTYQLSAKWQSGIGMGAQVGAIPGTLLNGALVAKFGHIRVLIAALISLSASIFVVFFAPNLPVLLVGQLLCGSTWGIFATSAPAYATELAPGCLRVYLTSWTNMCFIIGQFVAAGVLARLVSVPSEWSFRIPFAFQWIWPVLLIPMLCKAPDSAWHHVRHDRQEEAKSSLRRLRPQSSETEIEQCLASIIETNVLEERLAIGTSYRDLFKGVERRRTEIACVIFAGQVYSGSTFAYNRAYFFQQIGLAPQLTYNLNTAGAALALASTFVSWFIMPHVGRRIMYLIGMLAVATILLLIGVLEASKNSKVRITQAVLILTWTAIFQLSVGQLGWAIPAEIGSTRLSQKTVCAARVSYYVAAIIAKSLQPFLMNPTAWGLKGYAGFIWSGTAFAIFAYAYFRLPETKGRAFNELDILFAKKVAARKFSSYDVTAFDDMAALEVKEGGGAARMSSLVRAVV